MGSIVAPKRWEAMAKEARQKNALAESKRNCSPLKETDDDCSSLETLAAVGAAALLFGDD